MIQSIPPKRESGEDQSVGDKISIDVKFQATCPRQGAEQGFFESQAYETEGDIEAGQIGQLDLDMEPISPVHDAAQTSFLPEEGLQFGAEGSEHEFAEDEAGPLLNCACKGEIPLFSDQPAPVSVEKIKAYMPR